jgi:multidrug efflux pump subunit AcrA (membrane-fusion protein)
MCDAEVRDTWSEWWPEHAVGLSLSGRDGRRVGSVFFVRETPWEDADLQLLGIVGETWGYCAQALLGNRKPLRERWQQFKNHPRHKQVLIALAVLLFFPVRLSVLAPAEIIPLQAEAVAAPMDGVIKIFHVPPNTNVAKGAPLFSLDDTTLRNRRDVAQKSLAVARADALASQQKAFDSLQSKAELTTLIGRVREREAELAYLEESLQRIDVKAPLDGVFVYTDPNDWLGKPVVTGERIAQLAHANALGVLVWLPVGDAINLEPGASMRVYLQVSPLSSLAAELVQTSYQATLSPEGIASYRIRGKLETGSDDARIGLRGVAKVYGGWRPLFYWVLRRPMGAFRQWLGV